MSLDNLEQQYYHRQQLLEDIGIEGQTALKNASVLCVGAGGLGTPALLYLALAGVGKLGIVDNDTVNLENLHRQILYTQEDLQQNKAEQAAHTLNQHNPHIDLNVYPIRLDLEQAIKLIPQYDIVLNCADNFASRYLINDVCAHFQKPQVYASALGFGGQFAVFDAPKGPCYRCIHPEAPPAKLAMTCDQAGIIGATTGILGSLQALAAIKLVLQLPVNTHEIVQFDGIEQAFTPLKISANPRCPCRQATLQSLYQYHPYIQELEYQDLQQWPRQDYYLIDVRSSEEHQAYNIGGVSMPFDTLAQTLSNIPKNKKIVLYCTAGVRSYMAAQILLQSDFTGIYNLTGGILAAAAK